MYSIGYRERNRIAQELAYDAHIDADKDLLRRYAPRSSLLVRTLSSSNGATLSYDIIYTLLQYCTREEILSHRKAFGQASGQKPDGTAAAKPPKKNSPKKKSTPKSTGKTSKTQTSSGRNRSTRTASIFTGTCLGWTGSWTALRLRRR